jgi:hypothetical protein
MAREKRNDGNYITNKYRRAPQSRTTPLTIAQHSVALLFRMLPAFFFRIGSRLFSINLQIISSPT